MAESFLDDSLKFSNWINFAEKLRFFNTIAHIESMNHKHLIINGILKPTAKDRSVFSINTPIKSLYS